MPLPMQLKVLIAAFRRVILHASLFVRRVFRGINGCAHDPGLHKAVGGHGALSCQSAGVSRVSRRDGCGSTVAEVI
jgi:hypothetical protein